jgi:hypothetical protein
MEQFEIPFWSVGRWIFIENTEKTNQPKTKCDRKPSNEGSNKISKSGYSTPTCPNIELEEHQVSIFWSLNWQQRSIQYYPETLSTVKTEQDSGIWGIRALGLWSALSMKDC